MLMRLNQGLGNLQLVDQIRPASSMFFTGPGTSRILQKIQLKSDFFFYENLTKNNLHGKLFPNRALEMYICQFCIEICYAVPDIQYYSLCRVRELFPDLIALHRDCTTSIWPYPVVQPLNTQDISNISTIFFKEDNQFQIKATFGGVSIPLPEMRNP